MALRQLIKKNHWTSWVIISGFSIILLAFILLFSICSDLPLVGMTFLITLGLLGLSFVFLVGVKKWIDMHRMLRKASDIE